jgi:alginate O-acetyltransferase complex protein AlgI
MLFNSYVFLFAFLPVVLLVYLGARRARNALWPVGWLVLASLFYYGWWQPRFLLLLLFSIFVNLGFGWLLLNGRLDRARSKLVLALGVIFNLVLLCYFKYAGFLVTNLNEIFAAGWSVPDIVLPIGISFITFQKIAFLVDAHRGEVKNFSLLNYALFVTFFPQLIAGPIVHHAEIMPQLADHHRRNFADDFAVGVSIFIVGLFKKVVIADSLSIYADAGYGAIKAGQPLDAASAWITVLSYTFQLYYDFSGYSDMAVGLARMFGIKLPANFYSPYRAFSIIDFWRRWHISLSRFLRDYLYISLGGNRRGPARRHLNLMLTMLLGGLWHGANWTFVLWGGAHGLMLVINHLWRGLAVSRSTLFASRPVALAGAALTFFCVTLAWVPFRAESMAGTRAMFTYLFPTDGSAAASFARAFRATFGKLSHAETYLSWFKAPELWPKPLPADYLAVSAKPVGIVLLVVALLTFLAPNTYQLFARFDPASGIPDAGRPARWRIEGLSGWLALVLAAMFVLCVLRLSRVSPFLYFQF